MENIILNDVDKAILEEATAALSDFSEGDTCTMKDLMSEDFLASFDGLMPFVGCRLSFLASRKLLPLDFCGFNNSRHNLYVVLKGVPTCQ